MKLTVYKVGETQISETLEVAPGIFRSGVFALADIAGYPGDLPAARQWIIDHLPAYQPGQAITPDGDIITLPLPQRHESLDIDTAAATELANLPGWATWSGAEAAEALRAGILAGMTKTEARTAIDAQLPPTLTAAEFRAAVIQVLKTLSDAVIDGRDLGHQNEARAIMYLRDVAIR